MIQPKTLASGTRDADRLFDALLAQVSAKLEAGERVDPASFAGASPEHIERLRRLLPTLQAMAELGHPAAEAPPSEAGEGGRGEGLRGTLGDFRIVREVGRGGMGVVYEAEQVSLGRRVALKVLPFAAVLDPRQLQRFKNEAQAAALLHHQNIVPIYSVGCERGVHYYAMQFVEGQTLAELIGQLREAAFCRGRSPCLPPPKGAGGVPVGRAQGPAPTPSPRPRGDSGRAVGQASCLPPGLQAGRLHHSQPQTGEAPALAPARPRPDATTLTLPQLATSASTTRPAFFRSAAQLAIQVAEALDHAHQQGVFHRDIKPSNLMIDVRGSAWITDFGLAHMEAGGSLTVSGDLLGTLRYMSPEQALAKRVVIDHRTDIYSLGVTLYELLTLQPAFAGNNRHELLRQIAFEEPRPPRKLNKAIPADLETVVLKAMAKNPADRYASAQALADDLRRFLDLKPIRAKRPTLVQRSVKWARRHTGAVAAAVVVLAVAVIALAVSTLLIAGAREGETKHRKAAEAALLNEREARQQVTDALGKLKVENARADDQARLATENESLANKKAEEARQQEAQTRRHLYAAHMQVAQRAWEAGHMERLTSLLDLHIPKPGEEDLRSFDWYYLWRLRHSARSTLRHTECVHSVAFSRDGKTLVTASGDGRVRLWDTATREERASIQAAKGDPIWCVALSPDGSTLATGAANGQIGLWDMATHAASRVLGREPEGVHCIAFSPDGSRVATASGPFYGSQGRSHVKLWDLDGSNEPATLDECGGTIRSVAFSPDGKTLAWDTKLWDVADARVRATIKAGGHALAFSPDGTRVARIGPPGLTFYDPRTGQEISNVPGVDAFCLAFSPDGKSVATGGKSIWDPNVRLWDVATGQERASFRGHTGWLWTVAFSPDGRLLASGGRDNTARLWDLPQSPAEETLRGQSHSWATTNWSPELTPIAFSPDGKTLATSSPEGAIKLWDVNTREAKDELKGQATLANSLAFSPRDGNLLAIATGDRRKPGSLMLWDTGTGRARWDSGRHVGVFSSVAFSPDGKTLAAGTGRTVLLCDPATGKALATLSGHEGYVTCLAFSPDGKTLAAGTLETRTMIQKTERDTAGDVRLWDPVTGRMVRSLRAGLRITSLAFAPKGHVMAVGCWDEFRSFSGGAVIVFDPDTGSPISTLAGHRVGVSSLAFSPDHKTLASASEDGTVKLWDTATWQERLTLNWDGHKITSAAFSPDGMTLATGSADGAVKFWRAATPGDIARQTEEDNAWKWVTFRDRARQLQDNRPGSLLEAVAEYSKGIDLKPDGASLWFGRAHAYEELKQFEKAIADYSKAIELDPTNAAAWNNRGFAYDELKQYDKAIAEYSKAIELEQTRAVIWINRGSVYAELKQYEKALADYSKAIETDPADGTPWYLLAMLHLKLDDGKAYRETCAAMLKHLGDTKDPGAAHWVARTCAVVPGAVADYTRPVQLAQAALESKPRDHFFLSTLGAVLYRAGKLDEAVRRLEEAHAVWEAAEPKPASSPAYTWFFLAMAHHRLGHAQEARQWLDKAVQWTEKETKEGVTAAGGLPWNRRLTFDLFRREAEALLGRVSPPSPEGKKVSPAKE